MLPVGFVLLASEVCTYVYVSGISGKHHAHSHFCVQLLHQFPVYLPSEFRSITTKKDQGRLDHHYVSSLINVGLNYLLILRIGMAGAAVATLDFPHSLQRCCTICTSVSLWAGRIPLPLKMWVGYAAVFAAVAAWRPWRRMDCGWCAGDWARPLAFANGRSSGLKSLIGK